MYAWNGVKLSLKQRNMKFHIFASICVVAAGLFFKITFAEWVTVIILIALVMAAEVINTAIEDEANIMRDELGAPYSRMGKAKDLAAGAVLILATAAAVIGAIIFLPRIWTLMMLFLG